MHRLSRQILCSGSHSRVVRAQRLSGSIRRLCSLNLGRHYASSSKPTSSEKFDRLSAALRPNMHTDELAMTVAAIVSSTKDEAKLGELRSVLHTHLNTTGINEEAFYTKVNDILSNPPEDNFESFIARLPTEQETSKKPSNASNPSTPHETPDTSVKTHFQAPYADDYPDLMAADPLLDYRDVLELPPDKDTPFHNRVIVRNHTSIFNEALAQQGFDFGAEDYVPTKTDETEELTSSIENLPLSPKDLSKLYRFPLIHKRITQQTGKGKIHRQFVLMVVGDGNGMVGLGQGKDDDAPRAEAKAYAQAVRNMDWVERFENRTIWTEMESKLGATQLILRPRPVGFGLRCNPNLHQVLKAAGIKDISAKVWGSRNPINVIKAAFRMLQAGHSPLAMGDGIGGPGRKLNKGRGLRSKSDVERERGRQLVSLRK